MHERVDVMGIPVDRLDVEGAALAIRRIVSLARPGQAASIVCTPNAEIMMAARKDAELGEVLRGADLVLADGAGVALAARILGKGRIPRAQGFDTTQRLLEAGGLSFYFLGGKPGVAKAAAEATATRHPRARVVGWRDGYFAEADWPSVVDGVNGSGADVLLVALGAPAQEKWMWRNRGALSPAVCMGVGGTLDVLAGVAPLAPAPMRRLGLEWLFRLARQPWRAVRMRRLPQFIMLAIRWRLLGPPRRAPSG